MRAGRVVRHALDDPAFLLAVTVQLLPEYHALQSLVHAAPRPARCRCRRKGRRTPGPTQRIRGRPGLGRTKQWVKTT
eukprot:6190319-Pleurochrysis_carterae.AAC.1